MKGKNQGLNSIFAVAEEMMRNNGEDSYYYEAKEERFIIASFDGLGGAGSKKYENYSGKTGAYVASRAICGGVEAWFCESASESELEVYIKDALTVCGQYADKAGRVMGSLSKSFPTTAAILTGRFAANKLDVGCFWAGDSRCYMLDDKGLHQLTADDLDGQDAMTNLTNDGVMTNVINASTPFEVHKKKLSFDGPCIFLTATDGCFGYLTSPMAFEYLLLDTLVKAKNIHEWKIALNTRMYATAGDDYTLCVAVCGFANFDEIRSYFAKRCTELENGYINTQKVVTDLWDTYKNDYSIYI